jgi:hypothetical protein
MYSFLPWNRFIGVSKHAVWLPDSRVSLRCLWRVPSYWVRRHVIFRNLLTFRSNLLRTRQVLPKPVCVSAWHYCNIPCGRAMAQAISHPPPTAEARVRSRVIPCGICGGQNGTGTGFSLSTSVFPSQFHSTGAPLLGKGQKIIVIFITGLHKKPQCCGASAASVAGPFTTKKKNPFAVCKAFLQAEHCWRTPVPSADSPIV